MAFHQESSSNLLSNGTAVDVVLPASGQMNEYKFDLSANGAIYNVEAHVYANDFNGLVAAINQHTSASGITAVVSSANKIRLSGNGVSTLKFQISLPICPIQRINRLGYKRQLAQT